MIHKLWPIVGIVLAPNVQGSLSRQFIAKVDDSDLEMLIVKPCQPIKHKLWILYVWPNVWS